MTQRRHNQRQRLIDTCQYSAERYVKKSGLTKEARERVEFALRLDSTRRKQPGLCRKNLILTTVIRCFAVIWRVFRGIMLLAS